MPYSRFIEKSGFFFLILFTLSICVSKSAVDIASGFILLFSICYMAVNAGRECVYQNRYIIILLLPLIIGFALSFFSLGGAANAPIAFLDRYRFFFIILPFTMFIRSEKSMHILWAALNVSAIACIVYGLIQMNFSITWGRTIGFHSIGRNSDLLMSIGLINLVGIFTCQLENRIWNIVSKMLIGINTVFMLTAVILMMRRGSYLGFAVGVFVFLLMIRSKKILALIVIALCASLYFSDSMVIQRAKSIVDFEKNDSNRERIQLLRTGTGFIVDLGLYFHGTGAKMSREPYTEYFYSHPPEYQEANKDIIKKQYFGNFHNSFLQMAVEYGLFFLLCYLAGIGYMLVRICRHLPRLEAGRKLYPTAAVVVTAGVFVSQFFHSDLYSYGGIPFILISAAGCVVVNRHRIMSSKTEAHTIANVTTEG